ncbi:MAG: DNA internalization-related competence protein ComEC/Rec2 [Deltaproteobacteria bacterium]|nr:DNA internalization-related competence protein ComEC/Rec2 [Deltaproteobacteria bacterium]
MASSDRSDTDIIEITAGKKVTIEGTVLDVPRVTDQIKRFELKTERIFLNDKVLHVNEKILVTVYNYSDVFPVGIRIRFPAYIKPFINFKNPGAYDYELSMRLKDISCNASVSDGRYIAPMGRGDPGILINATEYFRKPVRQFLKNTLSEKDYAMYRALLLGERHGIDDEMREPFDVTGMGHVLAVSGLHIGIIAGLSFFLCRAILTFSERLVIKHDIKKIAAVITCLPVIAYTGLSGFQVSGQRAMIMALTYLFSIILGKERDIWSTLIFAAFIILAIDPMAMESISFQLTFLAVTGILWLTPLFQKFFPDPSVIFKKNIHLRKCYFYITGIISASISAMIFLMPVTVFYFYRVSTVTIISNLIIIPVLGFLILPAGMLALIVLTISPFLAGLILKIGASGIHLMMAVMEYFSGFSWSSFRVPTPYPFEILFFYCLMFCIVYFRKWRWVRRGMILILILIVTDISFWIYDTRYNKNLRVTFIDVGQGNSALIQFPGCKRMLIDGGGFRTGTFDTGKNVIAPFLYRKKILRIDYIVLTHPHPDHLNGLRYIASEFDPSWFWYNGDNSGSEWFKGLMCVIESGNVNISRPDDLEQCMTISGVGVEILYPYGNIMSLPVNMDNNREVNNRSLVLRMTYKGRSVLFPGDIEEETEKRLVEKYGKNLKSDVLLAPHHGSKYSSTRSFLEMVRPEICIISSRKGNSFGFPSPETIERLKNVGSKIYRIDEQGAVRVEIGEDHFYSGYCIKQ